MENTSQSEVKEVEDDWMIRPCDSYSEEYSDCRSIRARFHQYFIFGNLVDCTQWKKDYDNCRKCVFDKNTECCEAVIQSEKERRHRRLQAHFGNDVWQKREEPPENWNAPLPEKMTKAYEYSYLGIKSKEMNSSDSNTTTSRTLCVLS